MSTLALASCGLTSRILRSTTHIWGVMLSFAKMGIKNSTCRETFWSCMVCMPMPLNVAVCDPTYNLDPLNTAYLVEWNQPLSHEWHRHNFAKLDGEEKALMIRQNTASHAPLTLFWIFQLVNFTSTTSTYLYFESVQYIPLNLCMFH